MKPTTIVLSFVAAMSVGCSDKKDIEVLKSQLATAQKQIVDIQARQVETESKIITGIVSLSGDVADLKRTRDWNKLVTTLDATAYLTPASSEYSVVRYDLGALVVSFENVEPYANGSRVTLRFGNPLSANVNGLNCKVDYGMVDENSSPKTDGTKSKDLSLSQTLSAGSWTNIQIVLEGVPTEKLGFVRLHDIKHTGIALTSPK